MAKNRIAMLRKEQGMNQKELGEKLGVGQTTVSAWETGKNEPDHTSLEKMTWLFHVSVGYLLGIEPESPSRGLTREEQQIHGEQIWRETQAQEHQKEIEYAEKEFWEEKHGISEEEAAEIEREAMYDKWRASELRSAFFEAFLFNEMCEYLNKDQRERALNVVRNMFPNAEKGKYTDEIAR